VQRLQSRDASSPTLDGWVVGWLQGCWVLAGMFGARRNAHWSEDFGARQNVLVLAGMFGARKNSHWLEHPDACNAFTSHERFKFLYTYTQTANKHPGRVCVSMQRLGVRACQTGCVLP
jgi:hypothetical protein